MADVSFTFADLFAGIGGFHAALSALGGECLFVSEIDKEARAVYRRNWGASVTPPEGLEAVEGDIIPLTDPVVRVPKVDVLAAGFPCQPFSKSGFQRGINETRGTLFFNIMRILTDPERRPRVVLLENVRNLAGPRHAETWATIVRQLRAAGYKVSSVPTVFSPHLLPPSLGGSPQVRERVFICATYVGADLAEDLSDDVPVVPHLPVQGWDPRHDWDLQKTPLDWLDGLPLLEPESDALQQQYGLTDAENEWLDMWGDFVDCLRVARRQQLPGFPLWAEEFSLSRDVEPLVDADDSLPKWKRDFLVKNAAFYTAHQGVVDEWFERWFGHSRAKRIQIKHERDEALLEHDRIHAAHLDRLLWTTGGAKGSGIFVPASRRKLEWQAQETLRLDDCVIHLRPSGVRAKRPTYLPALVAITQTSILGWRRRRISTTEAARLQGLPDWFDFGDQGEAATYKQLGNGVSVGAAYYVLRQHLIKDLDLLRDEPSLVSAAEKSSLAPEVHRVLDVRPPRQLQMAFDATGGDESRGRLLRTDSAAG